VTLVFVGTDFHDSSFRSLERLERVAPLIRRHLVNSGPLVAGSLVVATCNRFEVYLDTDQTHAALAHVMEAIALSLDEPVTTTAKMFRVLNDSGAVDHLFQVASGLESMVVGESEIISQLRDAMAKAQELGTLSTPLLRAMERAFRVSKKVANSHGLVHSGRSLIDTALDMVTNTLPAFSGASVLVMGTGAYARVVLAALRRRGATALSVYSPSGRAEEFATSHGISAVSADGLVDAFFASDLVVSASGHPGYALSMEMMGERASRPSPITCIDVALSRDIDPQLEAQGYARIITLESIRQEVPRDHTDLIIAAENTVHEEALGFVSEDRSREVDPIVASLRAYVRDIINDELNVARKRVGDTVALEIERSLHRVTNHLLHTPSVRARDLAKVGLLDDYRKAVDLLFGQEVSEGV
jgi:glutamyl-tRNA reductase